MADTEQSILDIGGIPEIDEDIEVFGMTQAEVDKSLTLEDCAADAKAVGDRFGNVEGDISDMNTAIQGVDDRVDGVISDMNAAIQDVTDRVEAVGNRTGSEIHVSQDDTRSVSNVIAEIEDTVTTEMTDEEVDAIFDAVMGGNS